MKGIMSGTFSKLFQDFEIELTKMQQANAKKKPQKYTQNFLPEYGTDKMEEIAEEILKSYGCMPDPDCIKEAVDKIAAFFGVSISAARRRLIELGFEEVKGVYNYIDNKYVPAFGFMKGSLKSHQTYVVSESQVRQLVNEDKKLCGYFTKDMVRFVENHIVVNDSEFIERKESGISLTDYARKHLDSCAFKFDIVHSSIHKPQECRGNKNALYRSASTLLTPALIWSDENYSVEERFRMLSERTDDLTEIAKQIGTDFPKALNAVIEWSDMKKSTIARNAWMDSKTLYNLCNDDETKPTIQTVIRLCIAMNLPTEISYKLLNASGNPPRSVASDMGYTQFLDTPSLYDIETCNMILAAQGRPTLGGKNPDN